MVLESPATSPLLSDIGPKLSLYLLRNNELLELCKYIAIYVYVCMYVCVCTYLGIVTWWYRSIHLHGIYKLSTIL